MYIILWFTKKKYFSISGIRDCGNPVAVRFLAIAE